VVLDYRIKTIGYLLIDKFGADCLFQILSHLYERGSTLITAIRIYKHWATIFNNDAVLTFSLLDRLLHHDETVRIKGNSNRSQGQARSEGVLNSGLDGLGKRCLQPKTHKYFQTG
jgi:DNA replication protein DnaC